MEETPDKATGATWYVRGEDGQVFGPVSDEALLNWVREGRVEPTSSVSQDRVTWQSAPDRRELAMNWVVEPEPGALYGPFHRAVVDGLLAEDKLSKAARLYCLDDGTAAAEAAKREAELAAKTQALADLEEAAARQAETTKTTIAFMEQRLAELTAAQSSAGAASASELAAAREEIYTGRARAEKAEQDAAAAEAARVAAEQKLRRAEADLADVRAQLEAVTKFTRPTVSAAVAPEVIVADEPPPKSAPRFAGRTMGSGGLAALEAAARRELAAAKRQGVGLGGLFGGKKK